MTLNVGRKRVKNDVRQRSRKLEDKGEVEAFKLNDWDAR
jgi:hypothetical protein